MAQEENQGSGRKILGPGEYQIADGYRGILKKNVLVVKARVLRGAAPGELRCKDCKHRVLGHCLQRTTETYVCEMRPKGMWGSTRLFYNCPAMGYPCAMFDRVDPE